ncbi:DUF6262 family protein [uncultured Clostridium sp.]|uniref:DUF6262 family protein n=1 Tax=uncultured Clostridium sp. TaxID=59620 RepID=UPI00262B4141|nr:DUF6262 family protein [uncultured Clostridium sp.]
MARSIPNKLREKQEKQRKYTTNKIEEAIEMLKDLGYESISISSLVKETGFGRSTFSKPHVKDILKKHKIGKFKEIKTIALEQNIKYTREYITLLEKQLNNANIKINKLESELVFKNAKLKETQLNFIKVDLMNKDLADKFQRMYDRVVAVGVNIIL